MSDWQTNLQNDPYLSHVPGMNTRSVRRAPDQSGSEMINPAADPFMTNTVRGAAERPRVKVRIVSASGLPAERGSTVSCYATCMAKNKKTSLFRTKESKDVRNPVWDEPGGQMVMRWVPGDVLLFRVLDKDRSGMFSRLTQSDTCLAQCEIRSENYYPSGLQSDLPLVTANGAPIPGAALRIEVQVVGVGVSGAQGFAAKMRGCCSCDPRQIMLAIQHAPELLIAEFFKLVGDEADDRTKGDLGMLIFIPFLLFLLISWITWIVRHFNPMVVVMLDGVAVMVGLGLIIMGVTTHKRSKLPFFAIGCLMLIAVLAGVLEGESGWSSCWRQWWWMHTGHSLGASASTPAAARSDASVITFDNIKNGTSWTSVDSTRAAGFRRGDIYCAAPVLDPTAALGEIMRVSYWAIGINCCDDFGSFTCDASREISGSVGVVMKGGGMPCADCHANEFRLAALKAAGVNNMVSAPGALYVRFVSDPKTIENIYISKVILSVFWSLFFGLLFFGFLGWLTNYKGWGKAGHFPLYGLLGGARQVHVPSPGHMEATQEIVDEKKWTLVLSPSGPDAFSMAALKPEDDNTVNYSTC